MGTASLHGLKQAPDLAGKPLPCGTPKERDRVPLRALLQLLEKLEQRHPGSLAHARAVARYSRRLAQQSGLSKEMVLNCYFAGFLHDIGKLGVPADLLNKPGPLWAREEVAAVQAHVAISRRILEPFPALFSILDGPYLHHERWDGTGYPLGLRGRQIPLLARVIAVADVYDAITRPRPYRAAVCMREAYAHLWSEAGRHFDPALVLAFAGVAGEKTRTGGGQAVYGE